MKKKMLPHQMAAMAAMFVGLGVPGYAQPTHDRKVFCEVNGDQERRDKAEAKRKRRAEKKSASLTEKRP